MMLARENNERRVRRMLGIVFTPIILLLLADGFIGFQSLRSIQKAASDLAEDQFTQMILVDEVQREQGSLSAIFHLLARDPDSLDRQSLISQIETTERNMRKILDNVPRDNADAETWTLLGNASLAFTAEARRLANLRDATTLQSRELLNRHEQVLAAVSRLIRLTHFRSRNAKERIDNLAAAQLRRDVLLLGGSLLLALACAVLVMRTSTRLYNRIKEQSEQLARVSWHLLDDQEKVARRLSHDLHDELGQSLTALKTSFTRHAGSPCADADWVADCTDLLKESIRSVHEISQLLRPTILDDFGLNSALGRLCERLTERSPIDVKYSSAFPGRLPSEQETHLFRIAQEALTNAVRHSGASMVTVQLRQNGDHVHLSIKDDGKGLPPPDGIRQGAFGLIGMRARAQSSNGELMIDSMPGQGTSIEVRIPWGVHNDEKKDTHPVG